VSKNFIDILEQQEILQVLIDNGYDKFINTLLTNEKQCYTRFGRLNKSGACRVLGWKPKQLEDTLEECRQILGEELLWLR